MGLGTADSLYRVAHDRGLECSLDMGVFSLDSRIVWPPVEKIGKLAIKAVLRRATLVRACPSRLLDPGTGRAPHWFPGYVKPDDGVRGEGVTRFDSPGEWLAVVDTLDPERVWLEQPVVCGSEYRVTVFREGTFAVAKRLSDDTWLNVTDARFAGIAVDVLDVVVERDLIGIGADVIYALDGPIVLDLNTNFSLKVHGEDQARLAELFIDCLVESRGRLS